MREAAVLAMTCEWRGTAGVGKAMLVGGGDGVESVSVPDSSLLVTELRVNAYYTVMTNVSK